MNSQEITDVLIAVQAAITLLISWRAFSHWLRTHNDVLFSIGLSMGIIALGGIYGLLGDTLFSKYHLETLWFRYVGQIVGYLFIYLIAIRSSEQQIKRLKQWHIAAFVFLLMFLALTLFIPTNPDPITLAVLSGSRSVICFAIFLNYIAIFTGKQTRFSLLMSMAFLFITFGIWIYTMKFVVPDSLYLVYVGDSIRVVGLVVLLVAMFMG